MFKFLKVTVTILFGLVGLGLIFFAVMYFSTAGDYKVAETVAQNPGIPHISVDGIVFHSETFGNDTNQVVVVIHGGPGNDYRSLLPLQNLSDNYFVVFYDQRGAGLSPRVVANELSLEISIEDLDRIINYYSPGKKVYLIGHSWGGMLASGYIARHPDKVEKAVLAEPGMLTDAQAEIFASRFKIDLNWNVLKAVSLIWFRSLHVDSPDEQAGADYFLQELANSELDENPMKYYFCGSKVEKEKVPFWRMGSMASKVIHEKGIGKDGKLHIDLVTGVEKFNNKILFLCGSCSEIIGPEYQKEHMKYFKNTEMVIIQNAGHYLITDKPEECTSAIRNYFDES